MSARGGLDLGGTKIQAAVVDQRGRVIGESRHPTPTSGGPDAVAKELIASMREAADAAGVEVSSLSGVGVGSPGEIDAGGGTVAQARNLSKGFDPYPLARGLSGSLKPPGALGNEGSGGTQAGFEPGAGRGFNSLPG